MLKNKRGNWLVAVAVLMFVVPTLAAAKPFDNLPFDKLPLDKIPLGKVPFAYSELYVIGNSLSDVGNAYIASEGQVPSFPYNEGRFTNGPNYTDYLAENYRLLNTPNLGEGNNFAWGGARTSNGDPVSGLDQLGQYLAFNAAYPPDEDALFVVFLGGNNLRDIITEAGTVAAQGGNPMPIIQAGIAQAIGDMSIILNNLIGAGAVNIVVPNVPNMGQVPGITMQGSDALNYLAMVSSQGYNEALEQLLAVLDNYANIMRVNVYDLFGEVVADPTSFGLANATDPCIFEIYPGEWVVCENPDEYLFWDFIHPTTVGHMLLSDTVLDAVLRGLLPAVVSK